MKTIILTQFSSKKRICIWPTHFILHQPRKIQLTISGKAPFDRTTLMSTLNPGFTEEVCEEYELVRRLILEISPEFVEFRHGETGTLFLLCPSMFEVMEQGSVSGLHDDINEKTCLVSLWNPSLWVPICETFDEACAKMSV